MDAPDKYDAVWCAHLHRQLEEDVTSIKHWIWGNGTEGASVRITKIEQMLPELIETNKKFHALYPLLMLAQTVLIGIFIGVAIHYATK